MTPLLGPQKPEDVSSFMEKVQPTDTIIGHMQETTTQVAKALGAVATIPVTVAAGGVEAASYLAANVTGILPVGFNAIGKAASSTRSKIKNVFGMAA